MPSISDKEKTFAVNKNDVKFAYLRRSPGSLYLDVESWMLSLKIQEVISHHHTESNGYLSISLFYR